MDKITKILVAIIIIIIMVAIGFWQVQTENTTTEEPITVAEEKVIIYLNDSSIEVGDVIISTANTSLEEEYYEFSWSSSNPKVLQRKNENKGSATFVAKETGEATITCKVKDMIAIKKVAVYPRPFLEAVVNPWIYAGIATNFSINQVGVKNVTYKVTNQFDEEVQALRGKKILIKEPGNYDIIVHGNAMSDNRKIENSASFRVGREVKRGLHSFSFENEDILSLSPEDEDSIEIFLSDRGIEIDLEKMKEEKKNKYSFNKLESKYLFYKDSSREDILCVQEEVYFLQNYDLPKTIWRKCLKARDGRRWIVAANDFFVAAFPDSGHYIMARYDNSEGGDDGGCTEEEPSPIPTTGPRPKPPAW